MESIQGVIVGAEDKEPLIATALLPNDAFLSADPPLVNLPCPRPICLQHQSQQPVRSWLLRRRCTRNNLFLCSQEVETIPSRGRKRCTAVGNARYFPEHFAWQSLPDLHRRSTRITPTISALRCSRTWNSPSRPLATLANLGRGSSGFPPVITLIPPSVMRLASTGVIGRTCARENFCTTTLVPRYLVRQTHWDTQRAGITFEVLVPARTERVGPARGRRL